MTLVYNKSLEQIPAFGIMQIDDGAQERDGQIVINVKKPDGEFRPNMFLINGPVPIPPSQKGDANLPIDPVWCLYETTDEPATTVNEDYRWTNQDWGPQSGSWKLHENGTGFQVLSRLPDRDRVIVRMYLGPQLFMAQVGVPETVENVQTQGSTGIHNRIAGTKGSETELTTDSVQVYDRYADVPNDSISIIGFIDGNWEQVVGECTEE